MAVYEVTGPGGKVYEVEGPAGASKEQVLQVLQAKLAAQQAKTETAGLGEALKGGFKQFGRTFGTGIVGAFAPEEAAQRYLKESKEAPIKQATSLEAVKQKYLESGFFPAAGEALSQIPGAILEQAPNLAATAAGARLGAMAGAPLGLPGVIGGGVLGAAVPSVIQAFGGNIGRQAEEQRAAIEAGATPEISRGAAAAAALPQAALDVASQRLVFGKQLVGKVLGLSEAQVARLEGKALVAAERRAEKLAADSALKTAAKGVGVGALAEMPTEVAQQMLERAQAGLPLFSDDAKDEYFESAYGAALVSPLGAVGRFSERGAAREEVAAREAQRQQAEQQLTQLATGIGGVGPQFEAQQALLSQFDALNQQRAALKEQAAEFEKAGNRVGMLNIDAQLDALDEQEKQLQEQAKEAGVSLAPKTSYAGPLTIEAEIEQLEKQYKSAKTAEERAAIRDQLVAAYTRRDSLAPEEEQVPEAEGFTAPGVKKRGKKKEGEAAVAEEEEAVEEAAPPLVGPVIPARYTPEYGAMIAQKLSKLETETQRPKGVGLQAEKNRQANLFNSFNTLLEDARNLEYSKTDEELAEDQKDAALNDLKTIEDRLNTLKERFIESAVDEIKLAREEAGVAPASEKELSDATDKIDKLLTEIASRTATPNYNKRAGEAVDPEQERFNFSVAERRRLIEDYGLDENIDYQLALLTREIGKLSATAATMGSVAPSQRTARTEALAEQNAPEIRRVNAQIDSLYKDRADLLLNNLRAQLARIKNEVAYGAAPRPSVEEAAAGAKAKVEQRAAEEEERLSRRKVVSPVEKPIPLQVTEEDKAAIAEARTAVTNEGKALVSMPEYKAYKTAKQKVVKARSELKEMPEQAVVEDVLPQVRALGKELELLRKNKKAAPEEITSKEKEFKEAQAKLETNQAAIARKLAEIDALEKDLANKQKPLQSQMARIDAAKNKLLEIQGKPGKRLEVEKGKRGVVRAAEKGQREEQTKKEREEEQRLLEFMPVPDTTKNEINRINKVVDLFDRRAKALTRIAEVKKELATKGKGARTKKVAKEEMGGLRKNAASLTTQLYDALNLRRVTNLSVAKREARLKNAVTTLKQRRTTLEQTVERKERQEKLPGTGLSPLARAQRETRLELADIILALRKAKRSKDLKLSRPITIEGKTYQQFVSKDDIQGLINSLRKKVKKGAISFEAAVPTTMKVGRELATLKKRGSEIQQILSSQIDFARKRTQLLADAAQARKEGNKELADELRDERIALEKGRPNVAKLQAEYDQLSQRIRELERAPATEKEEKEIGEAEGKLKRDLAKFRTLKEEEVGVAEPVDELDVLREAGIDKEFSLDNDGNVYRRGATRTPVSQAEADAAMAKVKPPKGVKFVYSYTHANLPQEVRDQLPDDGNTKGAVLPDGTVVVIGDAHSNTADMQKTVAHEVVGHYGVDMLLGPKGMKDLTDRTMRMQGGIQKLAESFGKDVGEATLSTALYYQRMADQARKDGNEKRAKELEELGRIQAMRELIAHVEETRPSDSFLQKANRFIKELVGYVRAALRKMGLVSYDKVSTSDIYKLLRDARKSVGKNAAGVYVSPTGEVAFRKEAASYAANVSAAAQRATGIVGSNRKTVQEILANNVGLQFITKFVDRFAPLERVAAFMKDSAQATQMMYFLRMHDQGIAWTQSVLTKGPMKLVKDSKGYLMLQTSDGPNVQKMVEALKDAKVGNPEATKKLFTTYLLAERAEIVGYDKLKSDLGLNVSKQDLKEVLDLGRKNAAFQEAKKIYNEHNNGLVDALVESGAMSKEDAAKLKNKSYVPYYRVDKNGEVRMFLGGEGTVRIGDVKNQPYLHELVGGNEKILDVFASSIQNTRLLTDMALRNLATRNAAFGLQSAGMLKDNLIRSGDGPADPNVIRFKIDGENKYAIVDSDKAGIPSELLVSGMEGIKVAMPLLVRMLSAPAGILRKFITRNPVYAMRQLVRDSTTNYFLTGADTKPIFNSASNLYKLYAKKKDGSMPDLQSRGIISGNVLTGTSEQMEDILLNMVSGKPGWEQQMAKLDILAQRADEASRISIYNDFRKQGLSDMEATMATLESMNFNKRGTSPSIFMLNAMVPFLNAQIQGLNVLQKSLRGKMPFGERLKQRRKLVNRAMFMVATTAAYAMLMSDDEAYENADPVDRYNNWFVRVPGLDEPVRIPIPFEVGLLFKAIPEAMIDLASGDAKAEQAVYGISRLLTNSMPIGPSSLPAGIKPIVELTLGSSFYSGLPIESEREKQLMPEYRTREKTTEIAKSLGSLLGVSPIQLDYLINGYFSGTGLALAGLGNFILRSPDAPQQAEKTLSEMPVIGSLFQTNTGSGYVNTFYRQAQEIEQAKATFDALIKKGDADGALRVVETSANQMGLDGFVKNIKQQLADIREAEKAIRASDMTPAEKAKAIKDLRISSGLLAKAANQGISAIQ